jgi:hypothetical protein
MVFDGSNSLGESQWVFNQVAVFVLIALYTLAVTIRLIESQVRIRTHRVEVTRIIFADERFVTTDARSVLISLPDVCVKWLLQVSSPVTNWLDPVSHCFDFTLWLFLFDSFCIWYDALRFSASGLKWWVYRFKKLLADFTFFHSLWPRLLSHDIANIGKEIDCFAFDDVSNSMTLARWLSRNRYANGKARCCRSLCRTICRCYNKFSF